MRDGPSTGTPTFTSQGDLSFALHASFGGTSPIVVAPSTFEEAYSMMGQIFDWADRYQHPVIFLVDKQLSEGYKTVVTPTPSCNTCGTGSYEGRL